MLILKEKYKTEVVPKLMKQFGYANPFQVPKLVKVVVNRGVGEAISNPKAMDISMEELATICGQKPAVTKSKKSIAVYKLRAKQAIGCKVTLRGARMYQFLSKLINISLPRIRDFRGMSPKSFDATGNYTMGVTEQLIFPEINYDKIDKVRGMDITIVMTSKTKEEAKALLSYLGMPFREGA